jgi:hypothetical protein
VQVAAVDGVGLRLVYFQPGSARNEYMKAILALISVRDR